MAAGPRRFLRPYAPGLKVDTRTSVAIGQLETVAQSNAATLSTVARGNIYLGRRTFTVSSLYTPTPGATTGVLTYVGGGGGGGGASGGAAGAVGGGGASGAIVQTTLALSGVTIKATLGAGGTGGAGTGGAGGTGGSTTVVITGGTTPGTYVAMGGGGGGGMANAVSGCGLGGLPQAGSTGPGVFTVGQWPGGLGIVIAVAGGEDFPGPGGSTPWGTCGYQGVLAAVGFGAGGGGAAASTANVVGGVGAPGLMFIDEYITPQH